MRRHLAGFSSAPTDPLPLALFRVSIGVFLALRLAGLWLQFGSLLSLHGPLAGQILQDPRTRPWLYGSLVWRANLFALWDDDRWTVALLALYGASLAALVVGWRTRAATVIAFALTLSLHRRVPFAIWCGGDYLAQAFLFWLCFVPSGARLSLDARRHAPVGTVPVWSLRLLQAQLALVYASSFVAKLGATTWRDGTALAYALRMEPFTRPWSQALSDRGALVAAGTYGTLLVELAFPLLVWFRRTRPWILAAGVALHLGIEATLRVHTFSWAMLAGYALFVEPSWIQRSERNERFAAPHAVKGTLP